MQHSIGWDIGGAHIKVVEVDSADQIIRVIQEPCSLWKGLEHLKHAVKTVLTQLTDNPQQHTITMTGELVDLFSDRAEGVEKIIKTMNKLLDKQPIFIYAGKQGLLPVTEIEQQHYEFIASANWLASASYAAQSVGDALFVDVGSTTTDVLLLTDKQVDAIGLTDYQRLQSRELVYTGVIRTAVIAVAQKSVFKGHETGLMAEYFAAMSDVYRLTGELIETHDQTETADGGEKTITASAKRLSRMIGRDFREEEMVLWHQFAEQIRTQQLQKIQSACEQHLSRLSLPPEQVPIIGAGVGRFLVRQIAKNLNHPYIGFNALTALTSEPSDLSGADCAPAVAVACLARNSHG